MRLVPFRQRRRRRFGKASGRVRGRRGCWRLHRRGVGIPIWSEDVHIIVEAYLFLFSSPSFPPLLCFSFDDCFFRVGFGMYKNGIWVLGFFSKMYMFIYILMGDVGYSPSYPSYHKPPHVLNCLKDLRGKASIVLKYAVSFRSYAMLCYAVFPFLRSYIQPP